MNGERPGLQVAGPADATTVIVDNRLRQRYISVAKAAGRRRLHRLAIVVGIAVLALVGLLLVDSPLLDVDDISVSGATHTDEASLLAVAGISRGDALLTANLGAAERRIESLPWVADATVERSLPGTLGVTITERVPETIINPAPGTAPGGAVLVDDTGRILQTGTVAELGPLLPTGLQPVTIDIGAQSDVEATYEAGDMVPPTAREASELAARVRDNPAGAVGSVVVGEQISLSLRQGGSVILGDMSDLDTKIEAFRTMVARVDLTCLDQIDLTVPTHPTLTRKDPCS